MQGQIHLVHRLPNVARASVSGASSPDRPQPAPGEVRVLSFASGKGGVGKSHIVVNLAYALQQRGAQVMILDSDLGLANVDVLLGLAPRFNLQHVLEGKKALVDILVPGPAGMIILPASSGVHEVTHLTEVQRFRLLDELEALPYNLDFLLVDTGAGITTNVIYFTIAAQDIVLVVTPEPTSLTDAYALMKILVRQYAEKHFKVILNAVASATEAQDAFRHLSMVTERFLNISLDYLGCIPHDAAFSRAVRRQKALVQLYPTSLAAQCFHDLAERVMQSPGGFQPKGNLQFFWKRLLTRHPQPISEELEVVQSKSEDSDDEGVVL